MNDRTYRAKRIRGEAEKDRNKRGRKKKKEIREKERRGNIRRKCKERKKKEIKKQEAWGGGGALCYLCLTCARGNQDRFMTTYMQFVKLSRVSNQHQC